VPGLRGGEEYDQGPATSSGLPIRPAGIRETSFSRTSAGIAWVIGVSTRLGATALTRTRGAQRNASARLIPTRPDFEAT
jgi:hypothetical protein